MKVESRQPPTGRKPALRRRLSFVVMAAMMAAAAFPTHAQQAAEPSPFPRGELFAGFSYARVVLGSQTPLFAPRNQNYSGVHFAGNWNPHRNIGLLFEVAVETGNSQIPSPLAQTGKPEVWIRQFLVGPQFTIRSGRVDVFAHPLVGLNDAALEVEREIPLSSCSLANEAACSGALLTLVKRANLALGIGGGLDIKVSHYVAIRSFQADYLPSRLDGNWQHDFRVSTGVVFKFAYSRP
jgi:hypothetical protein